MTQSWLRQTTSAMEATYYRRYELTEHERVDVNLKSAKQRKQFHNWVSFCFLFCLLYCIHGYFLYLFNEMPPKPRLNVQSFPRPPRLERTPRHLQIKWNGQLIADTKDAYWVLETMHPPTYYFPPSSILVPLEKTDRKSLCEWKGMATYYSIKTPSSAGTVDNRVWSYDDPTEEFLPISGYLSFYAGPWECYVDDELVVAQAGDYYGGWQTSDIEGKIKGGPGTWGW